MPAPPAPQPTPLPPADVSDVSDADELSFMYGHNELGEFVRTKKGANANLNTNLNLGSFSTATTPDSSPEGGKTLPAPLTRMRSESAVSGSAPGSGSVRPFSRVASSAARLPTYNDVLAREKENRHPLDYSRSRTPGATLARVPSRTGKRDEEDGHSTSEEPATNTYSRTATVRRVAGTIRGTAATPTWTRTHAHSSPAAVNADDGYPSSGGVSSAAYPSSASGYANPNSASSYANSASSVSAYQNPTSSASAYPSSTSNYQNPTSSTATATSSYANPSSIYPTSSIMRTPSVTATLTRPRTTGPRRVTPAEKAKQEEDVRRELAEIERQRQAAEEEERRRAREEEDRRRRELRDEEERRRREREEADRLADEQREYELQMAQLQLQQSQPPPYSVAQGAGGWYQADPQHQGLAHVHRRRESETAMPTPAPAGLQVAYNARHSPSAPRHMRVAAPDQYASAPASNAYVASSSNAPPLPSASARHKRSPTAPEPRAVQQQQQQNDQQEQQQQQQQQQQGGGEKASDDNKNKIWVCPISPKYGPPVCETFPSTVHLQVNKKVYHRLDVLGKGGSSRVYRVLDANQNLMALKRVGLESADDQTVQGYLNEIQLLRRLDGNKRIIRLFDSEVQIITNKRVLFMIMEAGETDLAKLIAERMGEPYEVDWVLYFWRQMLQAVQVIHDEKIVHSDLKPANFVLVKGCLKLIDFGIANAIANDTTNIQRDHQIGTVNFMSPEALEVAPDGQRRFKVGRASDVWSLGCILYQMVYGQPPFASLSVYHKMKAIPDPNHRIEFPRESVPLIKNGSNPGTPPKRLESLARPVRQPIINTMRRCLERNPKERATIPELLADPLLTGDFEPEAPPTRPRSPPVPRPETEPRMAYVDDYYMGQVINWVVQKSGGSMREEDMQNTAAALIDELRKMYRVQEQDP